MARRRKEIKLIHDIMGWAIPLIIFCQSVWTKDWFVLLLYVIGLAVAVVLAFMEFEKR